MKVSFKITKKDLPRLIAAVVLAGVGIGFSVSAFYDAVIWFVLLFALTFITVTIDSEATGMKKAVRVIYELIFPVFASFFSVYFMQMVNLAHHDSLLGERWLYNQMYHEETFRWLNESLIVFGVYFFFRMLQAPRRIAAAITPDLISANISGLWSKHTSDVLPTLLVSLIAFAAARGKPFVMNTRLASGCASRPFLVIL